MNGEIIFFCPQCFEKLIKIEENEYKQNVDIDFVDATGKTPFLSACAGGKKEIIQFLLKYATEHSKPLNTAKLDNDKFSGLHYVVHSGSIGTLEYLLKFHEEYPQFSKIDLNGIDNSLKTPLHRAAEQHFGKGVAILVEQPGIELNLQDYNGFAFIFLRITKFFNLCKFILFPST